MLLFLAAGLLVLLKLVGLARTELSYFTLVASSGKRAVNVGSGRLNNFLNTEGRRRHHALNLEARVLVGA